MPQGLHLLPCSIIKTSCSTLVLTYKVSLFALSFSIHSILPAQSALLGKNCSQILVFNSKSHRSKPVYTRCLQNTEFYSPSSHTIRFDKRKNFISVGKLTAASSNACVLFEEAIQVEKFVLSYGCTACHPKLQ